ncbi:uncharacterized protein PADG_02872 [Paracoccidioides brasiliensis Pb18]|uniref:Magnesium transporter n=1 Tax=Paracoccidioides brasiliensis (strain Pb18) TaxID=502780 RepID=C1G6R7_PARBD|nr:uncharacterized protein PADG_02872 [Paracoccidioides brasiliensis Pb18]EEH46774.2 hypothetical protein PADG_02872 [Paracoccidioides brasiliensis Pb18]
MGFGSRLSTTFGLILIAHAGYSAHEHSILYGSAHSIPLDITFETLVAILFVTVGLVLGSEKPRPISWSVWAGQIEKEGGARNPFCGFEDRVGFWDVRTKREEFANWVRENGTAGTQSSNEYGGLSNEDEYREIWSNFVHWAGPLQILPISSESFSAFNALFLTPSSMAFAPAI